MSEPARVPGEDERETAGKRALDAIGSGEWDRLVMLVQSEFAGYAAGKPSVPDELPKDAAEDMICAVLGGLPNGAWLAAAGRAEDGQR